MIKRLGDVVYWTTFFATAFLSAMAVWVLQHSPMADPTMFALTVIGRNLVTFLLGLVARDLCRKLG